MKLASLRAVALAVGLCGSVAALTPADATNASATWRLSGGDRFQVNAWHCGIYLNHCSWTTSTKLFGAHPRRAAWIKNTAVLEAHGFHASLTISKEPGVTLTQSSKSIGTVTWINFHNRISDNSGVMSPNWTTVYVSTESCGAAKVNKHISVAEKCVYAGAA